MEIITAMHGNNLTKESDKLEFLQKFEFKIIVPNKQTTKTRPKTPHIVNISNITL